MYVSQKYLPRRDDKGTCTEKKQLGSNIGLVATVVGKLAENDATVATELLTSLPAIARKWRSLLCFAGSNASLKSIKMKVRTKKKKLHKLLFAHELH